MCISHMQLAKSTFSFICIPEWVESHVTFGVCKLLSCAVYTREVVPMKTKCFLDVISVLIFFSSHCLKIISSKVNQFLLVLLFIDM